MKPLDTARALASEREAGEHMSLADFRAEFPVLRRRSYLFTGGIAPAARSVMTALQRWSRNLALRPMQIWESRFDEWEASRSALAGTLGTHAERIALLSSTSEATSTAIDLVGAPPGCNVVVDETTYPSSVLPWMLAGRGGRVEVRRVASPAEGPPRASDIAAYVDRDTAAICISHVSPRTGYRHDLRAIHEIARANHALLLVDVAQSAGVVDVDLADTDMAFGTAMKWLLGVAGVGFLYVAPSVLRDPPSHVSYIGASADGDQISFRDGARKLEMGLPNLAGLDALQAALRLHASVGKQAIESEVMRLTNLLLRELSNLGIDTPTPTSRAERAGIVVARVAEAERLAAAMARQRIDVWGDDATRRLRIDVHAFNDEDDLGRVIDALRRAGQARVGGRH